MHVDAWRYLARASAALRPMSILELGSRDVNGSPRQMFPGVRYVGVDIADGPGVDIVADASTWQPTRTFDLVISMEVFEHTDVWPQILHTAFAALKPGGTVIVTAAGPERAPHSAVDGAELRAGEFYENVDPDRLGEVMCDVGFETIDVETNPAAGDVYATGVKCASS